MVMDPKIEDCDQQEVSELAMGELDVGSVVRHRTWDNQATGTVVRREDDTIYVAWHDTFVEDELSIADVEPLLDAPEHLNRWRGGIGMVNAAGDYRPLDIWMIARTE
jgi:hypothetical protein